MTLASELDTNRLWFVPCSRPSFVNFSLCGASISPKNEAFRVSRLKFAMGTWQNWPCIRWIFLCFFSADFRWKVLWQILQKGKSPSCAAKCISKCCFRRNFLGHCSHENRISPVCTTMCISRCCFDLNFLGHCSHTKGVATSWCEGLGKATICELFWLDLSRFLPNTPSKSIISGILVPSCEKESALEDVQRFSIMIKKKEDIATAFSLKRNLFNETKALVDQVFDCSHRVAADFREENLLVNMLWPLDCWETSSWRTVMGFKWVDIRAHQVSRATRRMVMWNTCDIYSPELDHNMRMLPPGLWDSVTGEGTGSNEPPTIHPEGTI